MSNNIKLIQADRPELLELIGEEAGVLKDPSESYPVYEARLNRMIDNEDKYLMVYRATKKLRARREWQRNNWKS